MYRLIRVIPAPPPRTPIDLLKEGDWSKRKKHWVCLTALGGMIECTDRKSAPGTKHKGHNKDFAVLF